MEEQLNIILILLSGIAVIPFLARTLTIPSAALEIVFGVILFNTIIHTQSEWFKILKEFGFIYLMFVAGMELDVKSLLKDKAMLKWYIVIPILSFIFTPLLFYLLNFSFYIGIALSMISAGIAIPVLKETGFIKSNFGKIIIGMCLTGELIAITILTGIDIYNRYGFSFLSGLEVLKLFVLLFLAIIFLKVLYFTAWWNPKWVEKLMESDDPVEEGVRLLIVITFAGAYTAHYAGVEAILGSFMAGVVFSYVFKSKGKFEDKINAIVFGFFTPFFFIGVGASFNIELLLSFDTIIQSLFFTFMIFISNSFTIIFSKKMNLSVREGLGITFLLSAPLSMVVVAGTLGVNMNLIDDTIYTSLILSALISSLLYPLLFRFSIKKQ